VTHYLRDIPAWPQYPNAPCLENMYAQYSEGFPGIVIKDEKIYVDRKQDLNQATGAVLQPIIWQNDFFKVHIQPGIRGRIPGFSPTH